MDVEQPAVELTGTLRVYPQRGQVKAPQLKAPQLKAPQLKAPQLKDWQLKDWQQTRRSVLVGFPHPPVIATRCAASSGAPSPVT